MGPGDELVEVVDETGAVLTVVSRQMVREQNLRHRCTFIVVVDDDDQVVVHQRAAWKDAFPSYWDICFGGICAVGESWELAAQRELAEEAGITGEPLVDLGQVVYDQADGRSIGRAYLAHFGGPVSCPDGEVVAIDRVPVSQLASWLATHQVCPDSAGLVVPLLRPLLNWC